MASLLSELGESWEGSIWIMRCCSFLTRSASMVSNSCAFSLTCSMVKHGFGCLMRVLKNLKAFLMSLRFPVVLWSDNVSWDSTLETIRSGASVWSRNLRYVLCSLAKCVSRSSILACRSLFPTDFTSWSIIFAISF